MLQLKHQFSRKLQNWFELAHLLFPSPATRLVTFLSLLFVYCRRAFDAFMKNKLCILCFTVKHTHAHARHLHSAMALANSMTPPNVRILYTIIICCCWWYFSLSLCRLSCHHHHRHFHHTIMSMPSPFHFISFILWQLVLCWTWVLILHKTTVYFSNQSIHCWRKTFFSFEIHFVAAKFIDVLQLTSAACTHFFVCGRGSVHKMRKQYSRVKKKGLQKSHHPESMEILSTNRGIYGTHKKYCIPFEWTGTRIGIKNGMHRHTHTHDECIFLSRWARALARVQFVSCLDSARI